LKKPVALLLGLAALGVSDVGTAAAQGLYYYGPGFYGQRYYMPGLAPWRVARVVRSAGLTPLSAPARRGPTYEVMAVDQDGRHVRVVISAYDGAITSVRPVAVLRQNGEPYAPRVAVAPPAELGEMTPGARPGPGGPPYARAPQMSPPPSSQPSSNQPPSSQPSSNQPPSNQRIANAPAITGATSPTEVQRTPMPRPRPNAASTAAVAPAPAQVATSSAQVATPSATATAPTDVPEAPPAPTRARPSAPTAANAAAPAPATAAATGKTATSPASAGVTTGSPSTTAAAPSPRPATPMIPVAPLD